MFVDTNVLVGSIAPASPHHELALRSLERARQRGEELFISRQIIREFLAVVTRPQTWGPPKRMEDALADVAQFTDEFKVLEDGQHVTETLIALCREVPVAGKQVHDANIVATMLAAGERRLLTFNTTDFRRYAGRLDLVDLA